MGFGIHLARRFGLLTFFLQATHKKVRVHVLRQFNDAITFGLTRTDRCGLFKCS